MSDTAVDPNHWQNVWEAEDQENHPIYGLVEEEEEEGTTVLTSSVSLYETHYGLQIQDRSHVPDICYPSHLVGKWQLQEYHLPPPAESASSAEYPAANELWVKAAKSPPCVNPRCGDCVGKFPTFCYTQVTPRSRSRQTRKDQVQSLRRQGRTDAVVAVFAQRQHAAVFGVCVLLCQGKR